jgi:hypothetical protein
MFNCCISCISKEEERHKASALDTTISKEEEGHKAPALDTTRMSNKNDPSLDYSHASLLRESTEDVYKKYEIIDVLGQGSMGAVSKGERSQDEYAS